MSVDPNYQGQGLGKSLIIESEAILKKTYQHIEMSARLTAVDFYKKLGYQVTGSPFIEVGMGHIKMIKTLS